MDSVLTPVLLGEEALVVLRGSVDRHDAVALRSGLAGTVASGVRTVVVDLAHVDTIDAQGVAALADTAEALRPRSGVMVLVLPDGVPRGCVGGPAVSVLFGPQA